MDKFLKYLPLATLMTVVGIGIGIAQWVIKEAEERKAQEIRIEATTFKDSDQRKDILDHEAKAPSDVETYLMFKTLDSVIKDKNIKDQWRDSMIMRMAVTQYQAKAGTDTLNKRWDDYNKSVEDEEN